MVRLALGLAVAAAALAGCTSTTRLVDASDPADLGRVQQRVRGRTADITLVSGDAYRGTVVFLRADSTAWDDAATTYAVRTAEVRLLVVDDRQRALARGVAIGGGAAFGGCFLAGAGLADGLGGDGGERVQVGLAFGALCIPAGLFYGLIGGAVAGRRTEYVLAGGPVSDAAGAAAPRDAE